MVQGSIPPDLQTVLRKNTLHADELLTSILNNEMSSFFLPQLYINAL
jgi:hypothetical protein